MSFIHRLADIAQCHIGDNTRVWPFIGITVKHHARLGANTTLLPNITLGEYAMVGIGSVVTKDVPPRVVVACKPIKIIQVY